MMKRSLPLNSLRASFVAKIGSYASRRGRANQHRPQGHEKSPKPREERDVSAQDSIALSLPPRGEVALVSHTVAPRKPVGRRRSALELHARYFDPDHDDAITPKQALKGMTDLGLPWVVAAPLALVIIGFLGLLTRQKASLSISVPDIARGKHPFESGVFGPGGQLDEAAFEELFLAPHARNPRDRLTYREFRGLVLKKGDPGHPGGLVPSLLARIFSAAEVFTLFCLASDCQKLIGDQVLPAMSRKNLRRFYEGRLLPLLARRRRILSVRAEL
jgi:hypothetical protein